MSSYRNQINDAIKAQLDGQTVAGSQIYTSLDRPLDPERDLPAIMIYTMAARRGPEDYGNALIPRTVTIAIEAAICADPGAAMEAAQDIADEIETAMEADPTLGKLVNDTKWRQTISDVSSHGSTVMGVCVVEYDVDIFTNAKPDGFYEYPEIPLTELPTEIIINPKQTPAEYAYPPDQAPYDDERLNELLGQDVTIAPYPVKNTDPLCNDGSCEVPAWSGDPE
jgi:hypothetical protein